jgi:hypothetical protein
MSQREPDSQIPETGEITVIRTQGGSVFYGERGQVSIRDQTGSHLSGGNKLSQDLPMTITRFEHLDIRALQPS